MRDSEIQLILAVLIVLAFAAGLYAGGMVILAVERRGGKTLASEAESYVNSCFEKDAQ